MYRHHNFIFFVKSTPQLHCCVACSRYHVHTAFRVRPQLFWVSETSPFLLHQHQTTSRQQHSMEHSESGPDRRTASPPSELRRRNHAADQSPGTQGRDGPQPALLSPSDTVAETEKALKASPPRRSPSWSSWAAMTLQVSLQDWILIATMFFGGCCSNVFALQILVK